MKTDWPLAAKAQNFVITTSRLLIRPLTEQDIQLYLSLYTNADTMAFVGKPLQPGEAVNSFQIALRLNAEAPFKRLFLTIVDQEQAAGLCAINQWNSETSFVEVGIMLLKPWHGEGYAKEALAALIRQVQQWFPGAIIKGDLDPQNKAAVQLVLKTGFQPDPHFARTYWVKHNCANVPISGI
jgi:RimJ/RimL family protein N-acetyltransferase